MAPGQGDFCLLGPRGCARKQKSFGAGWRSLGCVPVSPNPRRGRARALAAAGAVPVPVPVPAPPGLSSFPSTNTMSSFSSPQRTMRHCPACSTGNGAGNVSPSSLIPFAAPEEPAWGSPHIPKHFWEGFCPLCGMERVRIPAGISALGSAEPGRAGRAGLAAKIRELLFSSPFHCSARGSCRSGQQQPGSAQGRAARMRRQLRATKIPWFGGVVE